MIKNFLLCLLCLITGCSTTIMNKGLPNFHKVSTNVWRGGQPTTLEGWNYLHSLGITQIIKLNPDSEGLDDTNNGFTIHKFPITLTQQFTGNVAPQIYGALLLLEQSNETNKFYFHCSHGWDRTGLLGAFYNVRVLEWSKEKARTNMLQLGFHRSLIGLDWFWRNKI